MGNIETEKKQKISMLKQTIPENVWKHDICTKKYVRPDANMCYEQYNISARHATSVSV